MARDVSRARDLLPALLMTLLSVVQALALEALWSTARESAFLFEGGRAAAVGWLQVAAVFQGIVVVWLFYIGIVLRFSWVPSTWDSVAPFVIGALELTMLQLIGTTFLPYWFCVLAAIFAFSTWTSRRMFAAGLRDPANEALAASLPPSGRAELVPFVFVAALLVMGWAVGVAGAGSTTALVSLVLANLLLVAQAALIHRYWRLWVGGALD